MISLSTDAGLLNPPEMAARLADLTAGREGIGDSYGTGGAVAALEAEMAALLGKARAVMFPTGTLANLCAMRALAGRGARRILVHRDGHFYNDAGDNLCELGGFTMVPLKVAGAGFDAGDVEREIARADGAKVASNIGCIVVESPSRRLDNRRFGPDRMAGVVATAQAHRIPLFLDGARMLIECALHDVDPAGMAGPFDMVYVSLYKYLGAPFGCILAGDAAALEEMYHERRRLGGGLWQMWPAAVLASDGLARFHASWRHLGDHAAEVLQRLEAGPLNVQRYEDGTNAFRLILPHIPSDPEALRERAVANGLGLPAIAGDTATVKFNDSWNGTPAAEIAARIEATLT